MTTLRKALGLNAIAPAEVASNRSWLELRYTRGWAGSQCRMGCSNDGPLVSKIEHRTMQERQPVRHSEQFSFWYACSPAFRRLRVGESNARGLADAPPAEAGTTYRNTGSSDFRWWEAKMRIAVPLGHVPHIYRNLRTDRAIHR